MFTLSTISYDEFDNGNAFLFSLPVSRSGYVVEKYCLALLLGGGAWIFATVLAMGAVIIRKIMPAGDLVVIALFILPVMLMMQAVMLPIQLKFVERRDVLHLSERADWLWACRHYCKRGRDSLTH